MSMSSKRRTSTVVVKPQRDVDCYVLWDGVREEPYWVGDRAAAINKLSERSTTQEVREAASRLLERVDEHGTSLHYPSRTGEYLYGWQEDPVLYLGSHFVARDMLPELTRRLRRGEDATDLLQRLTEGSTNATVVTQV